MQQFARNHLPVFVLCWLPFLLSSQTNVSGNISSNVTWTLDGSPYLIERSVSVAENVNLTIEPGVIVKFGAPFSAHLIVRGALTAQGTDDRPIVFTSLKDDAYGGDSNGDGNASVPTDRDWRSITIESTSGQTSLFSKCLFRYGGYYFSPEGVIRTVSSSPTIEECTFEHNAQSLYIAQSSQPTINNCTFENITGTPVALSLAATPTFSNLSFQNIGISALKIIPGTYSANTIYTLSPIDPSVFPFQSYVLDDVLTIGEQTSLVIEPGAIIKHDDFDFINLLNINGSLSAVGTPERPIIFTDIDDDAYGGDTRNDGAATNPTAADWGGILLNGANSELAYCHFRFGGDVNSNTYDGALEIRAGSPNINNCVFFQCQVGLTSSGGSTPSISNNRFEQCTSVPVAVSLTATPSFSQNQFINNRRNGVGLLAFSYNTSGDAYTLNPISFDGTTAAPYIVYDDGLTIGEGVSLTITPGVIIKHDMNNFYDLMTIRGHLAAEGTPNNPIVFTHISDDAYGGDANNDGAQTTPGAEDWEGVRLEATAADSSRIAYCLFRYGGYDQNAQDAALEIAGSSPVIENNTFFNCGQGLSISNGAQPKVNNNLFDRNSVIPIILSLSALPELAGNTLLNNAVNAVGIIGGNYAGPADYTLAKVDNAGGTEAPYYLSETLTLEENVRLTIEAGTVIKVRAENVGSDVFIRVDGSLTANGTEQDPIVFTSIRDDNIFGDSNVDGNDTSPGLGDWFGVLFNSSSGDSSRLSYCRFKYGGYYQFGSNTLYGAVRTQGTSAPRIENCTFQVNSQGVVAADESAPVVRDCRFERSGWTPITVSLAARPEFSGLSFFNNSKNAVGILDGAYGSGDFVLEKLNIAGQGNLPYYIQRNITLGEQASLMIEPGVIIKFRSTDDQNFNNTGVTVEGQLLAEGTAGEPIIFTSERDDAYGGDTNNDGASSEPGFGDWDAFHIRGASGDRARFEYCTFRHGGYYSYLGRFRYGAVRAEENSRPLVQNCTFENTSKGIVAADQSKPRILNNTFDDMGWLAVGMDLGADPVLEGNSVNPNRSIYALGIEFREYDQAASYSLKKRSFAGRENISYFLHNGITLGENVSLIIEPGLAIKFFKTEQTRNNIALINRGTMIAEGTQGEPIIFTSWHDDESGGDTNYGSSTEPGPEDWLGLVMQGAGSSNSRLSHCQFRYGGFRNSFPELFGALRLEGSSPAIEFSTFEHNKKGLVLAGESDIVLDSCDFRNNEIGLSKEGGRVAINRSNIVNNSVYGVENLTTEDMDATLNWWGDPSGPYHPEKNAQGQGNAVTDYVLFEPYLDRKVAFERDIGITALLQPQTGCDLGAAAVIEVAITNFGNAPQTGFDVGITIDEEEVIRENVGDLIVPVDSTVRYTLRNTADLSAAGAYPIAAYTLLPDDQNIFNDRIELFVENYLAIPQEAAFVNLIPVNGDSTLQNPVQFSWSPIENADTYDLYVWFFAFPEPSRPLISDIDQITYLLNANFAPGATYRWKVVAKNPCSELSSPVRSFTIQSLPDLAVTAVQVPSEPFSGQEIEITWEVVNDGTNNTGDTRWFDAVFISEDPILDPELDAYLGAVFNDIALEAGEGYTQMGTFRLPQGIENTWYIFVVADYYQYLQERDYENNRNYAPIEINLTPPPDLQVSRIIAPANAFSEQFVGITWRVTNEGPGATLESFWRDAVYLSDQEELDRRNSYLLGRFDHTGVLEPGQSYERTETVALPRGIFGNYFFFVETDEGDRAFEFAFENNNIGRSDSVNVFLTPPPDLTPLEIVAPAQAGNWEVVDVRWTVTNQGASNTPNGYFDRLYLSASPTFDPQEAQLVISQFIREPVNVGEQYTIRRSLRMPDEIEGIHYFYLVTDQLDDIFEYTREDNNILRSGPIEILPADLAVTAVRTVDLADSGEEITINWTIANVGQGPLQNFERTDSLFLSLLPDFDRENALPLATTRYAGRLDAGQSAERQLTVTVPNGLSGRYYLFVLTDAGEEIFENGERANNINSTSLFLNLPPWPDLRPIEMTGVPASIIAGNYVNLAYTVRNEGRGAVAGKAWTDRLFISPSPTWIPGTAKRLKDFTIVASLQPEGTYRKTTSFILPMLPGGAGTGVCFLYIFTDAENDVFEHIDENDNILRSIPIDVTAPPPTDLELYAAQSKVDTTQSGRSIQVDWSVRNVGSSTAVWDYPFWYDGIYLSKDAAWDAGDVFVTDWTRPAPLDANAVYMDSRNFTVPPGLEGDYYFLIVTDHKNLVRDGDQRNNARSITGDRPVYIRPTLYPDLQAVHFEAPGQGTAGQPIRLRWTVTNDGEGPTLSGRWTDKVYLSTDFTIDGGDPILATATRSQTLGLAQSYTDSAEVFLPISASGNYILLFKTDANNSEFEKQQERNNVASAGITVTRPQPSDLIVSDIDFPEMAVVGEELMVEWGVQNTGVNPAFGFRADFVYLSRDSAWDLSDLELGHAERNETLAPGIRNVADLSMDVPGLPLGDYFVIVRADGLNNIVESNDGNNVGISERKIKVDVPALPIGQTVETGLRNSKNKYYKITVPDSLAGETLLVNLRGDTLSGNNELYISYGTVPTRSNHQLAATDPFRGAQTLVIPSLAAGVYYLLAYGLTTAATEQVIELSAEILEFEIRSVMANRGGNTGSVTVRLDGAKFSEEMVVSLQHPERGTIYARNLYFTNSTRVYATFPLGGQAEGRYDVVAEKDNGERALLAGGFEITSGEAISGAGLTGPDNGFVCYIENIGAEELLDVSVQHPPNTRLNRIVGMTIQYANVSNIDIPAPTRVVYSLAGAPLAFRVEDLKKLQKELIIEFQEEGGPPGILRPGVIGSIKIFTQAIAPLRFFLAE